MKLFTTTEASLFAERLMRLEEYPVILLRGQKFGDGNEIAKSLTQQLTRLFFEISCYYKADGSSNYDTGLFWQDANLCYQVLDYLELAILERRLLKKEEIYEKACKLPKLEKELFIKNSCISISNLQEKLSL